VIGAEPDHDPVTADNSDPSMSEPVIDGATVFDGRIPATRLLTRVVADVEPAAFFAVTTTASFEPIRAFTRLSVEAVAPVMFEHDSPEELHVCTGRRS